VTAHPQRFELMRWAVCAALVVFAHAAAAAIIANLSDPLGAGVPVGAITIDLAPLVTSTDDAHDDAAPGPLMNQSLTPPDEKPDEKVDEKPVETAAIDQKVLEEKVEPKPPEEPQIEAPPPAPKPDVVLPAPKPVAQPPREKPKHAKPSSPVTTAPQRAPNLAALSAAPNQGQISASANAMPSWKGQIVAAIERSKRYPSEAEARREQGTPSVSFSIDRQGKLLSSRLASASGTAALDDEALATIKRAQPFPPAPADIIGTRFDFTVPIRFRVR
jgi:periplasmic protein TonB